MAYVHVELDEIVDTLMENLEDLRGNDVEKLLAGIETIITEAGKTLPPLSTRTKRNIMVCVRNMLDGVRKWKV